MPGMPFDFTLPDSFDGQVRLFPLPNLVLFPGVVQGLHIFEPRYRLMMEDALATDRLITLVMLQPDQRLNEAGEPAIAATACIGHVSHESRLEDGRYNLFLRGVKRVRIERELWTPKPYRVAAVEVLEETEGQAEAEVYRAEIVGKFRELVKRRSKVDLDKLVQLCRTNLPLGIVIDLIAYASGIDPVNQLRILEAWDLPTRAQRLLSLLDADLASVQHTGGAGRPFPPEFSVN